MAGMARQVSAFLRQNGFAEQAHRLAGHTGSCEPKCSHVPATAVSPANSARWATEEGASHWRAANLRMIFRSMLLLGEVVEQPSETGSQDNSSNRWIAQTTGKAVAGERAGE